MRIPGLMVSLNHWCARAIVLLLVLVASAGSGFLIQPAAAQITCEAPASASSTPSAAATPVTAATDVVFPEEGGELTVFAAASLVDAFGVIEADLEAANPNLDITVETAGSQTLVTQLTEGAEADVLATASNATMTDAIDAGVIDGEPVIFTGNRLVIVAPEDNPAGIASVDDLTTDGINLVVANESVPAGNYSRRVLCAYGGSDIAPEGFVDAVSGNIVSEEEDVRNVLAKVQLGEADAGLVYISDAFASELAGSPLTVIEFPDTLNTTAVYPIAPVTGGSVELAQAFISYVLSADGQATLDDFGFVLPAQ